jgi:hypothetical protein
MTDMIGTGDGVSSEGVEGSPARAHEAHDETASAATLARVMRLTLDM